MSKTIVAIIGYERYNVPLGLLRGSYLQIDGKVREIQTILGESGKPGYRIDLFDGEADPPSGAKIYKAVAV